MPVISYREALNEALREEMDRDDSVFIIGEEVGEYDGAYKVTKGLLDEYGEWRVRDAPIAELGFGGLGVGAAMAGLRPIVEFMTWNFALLAIDEVINGAAKMYQMSGGQYNVPIVFRGPGGAALQLAAQHSQSPEPWYSYAPGLKVISPATAHDAKGLLKSAIRDDDPVVFIESEIMYNLVKDEVPEEEYLTPIGVADVKRAGSDVTIVCYAKMVHQSLAAAKKLEQDGIDAEVLDLRTVRPLDVDAVIESVKKTNRAVVAEEGWPMCNIGAQVVDDIQREAFDWLDAPVARVSGLDVPMPYAKKLEKIVTPNDEHVVAAARHVCYAD